MVKRSAIRGLCRKHPEVYCRLVAEDATYVCVRCTSKELVKDIDTLTRKKYPWTSSAFLEKKDQFAKLFETMDLPRQESTLSESAVNKRYSAMTLKPNSKHDIELASFKQVIEGLKVSKSKIDARMYSYSSRKASMLAEVRARYGKKKVLIAQEIDSGKAGSRALDGDGRAPERKRVQLFERSAALTMQDKLHDLLMSDEATQLDEDTRELLLMSMVNFLFLEQDMKDNAKMGYLLRAFKREEFVSGDVIIIEGEAGSKLYILDEGEVEIYINGELIRDLGRGAIFGELALLYDAPRSATVRCKDGQSRCVLWSLSRDIFKQIQIDASSALQMQRSRWLVSCKELGVLGAIEVSRLVSSFQVFERNADSKLYVMNKIYSVVTIVEKGFLSIYASESLRGHTMEEIDKTLGIIRPAESPRYVFEANERYAETLVAEAMKDGGVAPNIPAVHVCDVMEGCIIGIDILRGKAGLANAWTWTTSDDVSGAMVPFTAVAGSDVSCLSFSVETFERLVGDARQILQPSTVDSEQTQRIKQQDALLMESSIVAQNSHKFDMSQLHVKHILGSGSFGLVALADYTGAVPGNKLHTYALKMFAKVEIARAYQVDQIVNEKRILSSLSNPFILRLYGTAQSPNHVYIITEVLECGDLWGLIYTDNPKQYHSLPSELVQFYAASIVLGLAYLHSRGFAHRDIKPENVMIDRKGYVRIIDFGFSKSIPYLVVLQSGDIKLFSKSFTLCGTPEYLSPEVIAHAGHDHSVDLWALGIMVYEMFAIGTPFAANSHNNVKEIFTKITRMKKTGIVMKKSLDPSGKTTANDLVNSLVQYEPSMRLGITQGSTRCILEHPFFTDLDVGSVEAGTFKPSYIPALVKSNDPNLKFPPIQVYKGNQALFSEF